VVVRIVDRCPECAAGDLDLSAEAFDQIAAPERGRVPIRWRYVACAVDGPVRYHFKEGSNQWWTAVQLRNTRYAVQRLEARTGSGFEEIPRLNYNYFVAEAGLGPGPYTFRVTDVLGHQIEDQGIVFAEGQEVPGANQLPP
jgi:expansin (peptidoglycan-binding protein)